MAKATIIEGDCREVLATLDAGSVQTCVTSPPYFGLRDYGHEGQIGLEETPEQYVEKLVAAFRAVREVLSDDGTLWLNLGDSYASSPPGNKGTGLERYRSSGLHGAVTSEKYAATLDNSVSQKIDTSNLDGIKPKDLIGIPWLTAFALRADGWYLRAENIWNKPNPMPESVGDRTTRSHEQLFLLSKSARYVYDAAAIREEGVYAGPPKPGRQAALTQNGGVESSTLGRPRQSDKQRGHGRRHAGFNDRWDSMTRDEQMALGRNKRSVWTVATQPFPGAHFATFPPKLIEPCILAGSRVGDLVLDPFAGAGTSGLVALRHDRDFIGVELNPEYAEMARRRIHDDAPLLNEVAA